MVFSPGTKLRAVLNDPSGFTVAGWPLTVTLSMPLSSLAVPLMFTVGLFVYEPVARVETTRSGLVVSSAAVVVTTTVAVLASETLPAVSLTQA